jgi:hypothetical protein
MGLFERLFRGKRAATEARKAELRGDLSTAMELWAGEGDLGEVARLMILRGDAELDALRRLQHYMQAVATAPKGSDVAKQARIKRAGFTVALAAEASVSATTRRDLLEAAKELEDLGEAERAAEAYALVNDIEGQARALAQAGQVERLERLLSSEQAKANEERHHRDAYAEVEVLVSTGDRREALAAAERLAMEGPLDMTARERAFNLKERRVMGGVCRILLEGRPLSLLVDSEVIIGRTEGSLLVHSNALSRKHAAIARTGDQATVRDLGSRNGTLLRGMRIEGALPVGQGIELDLGGEVKLKVAPSVALTHALDIDVGGERYLASLGPLNLGVLGWRLERAADGWLELVTEEGHAAYRGTMAMMPRTTLLVGDALSSTRGGAAVLEVLGIVRSD